MLGPTFPVSVVVVDADHDARSALVRSLRSDGFGASGASTGIAGIEQALGEACDVVVAALPLPDLDVRQLVSMIRAVGDLPVIVVTDDADGVIVALDAGAADASVGPAPAGEVAARIRAVVRRRAEDEPTILEIGGLRIDPGAREARVDGTPVELSRKEFDVLQALASRQGQVVSKRELLAEVWHQPYGGSDKTVDVHLSWLRKKLGESAAEPRFLRTVRGVGVRLVDPSDR